MKNIYNHLAATQAAAVCLCQYKMLEHCQHIFLFFVAVQWKSDRIQISLIWLRR